MKTLLVIAMTMLTPVISQAARPWLLPSQTVLARSGGWVAVDAAMADDLFSFNQGAMPVDSLVVVGPDGQAVAPQNLAKSRSRASFDLELRLAGTYRIAVADDAVMARWEEDGKPKRWRGTAERNSGECDQARGRTDAASSGNICQRRFALGPEDRVRNRNRAHAGPAPQRSLCA
jgi:hypothetical protein